MNICIDSLSNKIITSIILLNFRHVINCLTVARVKALRSKIRQIYSLQKWLLCWTWKYAKNVECKNANIWNWNMTYRFPIRYHFEVNNKMASYLKQKTFLLQTRNVNSRVLEDKRKSCVFEKSIIVLYIICKLSPFKLITDT